MTMIPARPAPGRRADYVGFLPLSLRLMDNDIFGHVNNAHYYSLFDTTVCEFLTRQRILRWPEAELLMVMAESGCRYHSEIAFPDRITGAMRVLQVGRRSVRYAVGVFREDAEVASAEGFLVHVCVDAVTRRPTAVPDAWRAVFDGLMIHD